MTTFTHDVSSLVINADAATCPTDNLTFVDIKDAAGTVVNSAVYSPYISYDSSTKVITIQNYGAIEVPTFTGLQINFQAMHYLNSFSGQYLDLSIDYNLCRNMSISFS